MFRRPSISPKFIATIPVLLSSGMVTATVYHYGWWAQYLSPLILGILAGGLVDLDNGFSGRLKNIWFSMIAFAFSSLAVQMTFGQPMLLVTTFTSLAFIFTMFGAAGNRYRTIAFATLAVAVYTALSHSDYLKWYVGTSLVLCGALLHSVCSLLVHMMFPYRPVQENMATAYAALARYLDNKADFFDPDEVDFLESKQIDLAMNNTQVIQAFSVCQNALFYRMRGQHRHPRTTRMLRYYFIAQDIHERISSSHVHYQAFLEQMKHTDLIYRIQRLLRLQAQACQTFSGCLKQQDEDYQYSAKLERATLGAEASLQYYANQAHQQGIAPYRVQRLLDNIMHVSRQFSYLGKPEERPEQTSTVQDLKTRLWSPEAGGFKGAWRALKNQATVQSPVFRHAVRMAVIVCACCLFVYGVPHIRADFFLIPINEENIHFGYWILLTAVFVCQPNYSATKKRLVQRILGTVAGVIVGAFLPYLHLSLEVKLALMCVMLSLFFLFRTNKHSFSTFFSTLQALLGFSIAGHDVGEFFVPRVLDTVIGAAISGAAVYCLWPDWKYLALDKTGMAAMKSNAGYLKAVLCELREYNQTDSLEYRQARRLCQDRAASLSSAVSDMSSDPKKYGHRLKDGFLLLKINYSVISYISALGAYRNKMQRDDDETVFLFPFFAAARQLYELMENIVAWPPTQFQAALMNLQNDLEALRPIANAPHADDTTEHHLQNQVLWQQLLMITELLQPYYDALHNVHADAAEQQAA